MIQPLIEKHAGPESRQIKSPGNFPHILAITFTNKAAQELKHRLGKLLTSSIQAAQGQDASPVYAEKIKKLILRRQMYIGTFHSLCYQLLLRFAKSYMNVGQFSILDLADSRQLIRLVIDQLALDVKAGRLGFSAEAMKHFNANVFLTTVNEHKQRYRHPTHLVLPTQDPWAFYSVEHFTEIARDKISEPRISGNEEDVVCRMYTEVYRRYTAMMRTAKQLDFDDLLQWAIHLLRRMPPPTNARAGLRSLVVSELYVDEFQDTNCLQLEFLSTLQRFCSQASQPLAITLVGDPDQTIFTWRNFKPSEATAATDEPSLFGNSTEPTAEQGWDVLYLTANFRSPPNIPRAASTVIEFDSSRKKRAVASNLKHFDPSVPGGPCIVLKQEAHTASEYAYITAEIQRLKASAERLGAPFQYRDVAVLMRAASTAKDLMQQLTAARIPSTGLGGAGLWDSKVVRDVLAYMRLLRNPSDLTSLLRAINAPPRKVAPVTKQRVSALVANSDSPALDALLQFINGPKPASPSDEAKLHSHAGLKRFVKAIEKIRTDFAEPGCTLSSLLTSILKTTEYEVHLPPPPNGEEDETNPLCQVLALKQLTSTIQSTQFDSEDQEDLPLLNDVDCLLESAGLGHSADEVGSKPIAPDAVRISTLHSCKGLEWPFVFIAGAHGDAIPHFRCETRESIDEEARLMYVGVTRCQYQLYVSWFKHNDANGEGRSREKSPFLSNIPSSILSSDVPSLDISFWTVFGSAVNRPFSAPNGLIIPENPQPESPKRPYAALTVSHSGFVSAGSLAQARSTDSASRRSHIVTENLILLNSPTPLRSPKKETSTPAYSFFSRAPLLEKSSNTFGSAKKGLLVDQDNVILLDSPLEPRNYFPHLSSPTSLATKAPVLERSYPKSIADDSFSDSEETILLDSPTTRRPMANSYVLPSAFDPPLDSEPTILLDSPKVKRSMARSHVTPSAFNPFSDSEPTILVDSPKVKRSLTKSKATPSTCGPFSDSEVTILVDSPKVKRPMANPEMTGAFDSDAPCPKKPLYKFVSGAATSSESKVKLAHSRANSLTSNHPSGIIGSSPSFSNCAQPVEFSSPLITMPKRTP